MEAEMSRLSRDMQQITECSNKIDTALAPRQDKIEQLSSVHNLLQKVNHTLTIILLLYYLSYNSLSFLILLLFFPFLFSSFSLLFFFSLFFSFLILHSASIFSGPASQTEEVCGVGGLRTGSEVLHHHHRHPLPI